jgi:hypothetical protein
MADVAVSSLQDFFILLLGAILAGIVISLLGFAIRPVERAVAG